MLTVGPALLVTVTSSDAVHPPVPVVHLTVALVPAATPVTVVVGDEGVVMAADPLTNVQVPVPVCVMVKVELLQFVWSG